MKYNDNEYYHSDSGDLWVNVSAVRRNQGFEILPISNGAGEVGLDVTQIRASPGPCLQAVLTESADQQLLEFGSEDNA